MPIPDGLSKIRISGDVRHPRTGAAGTGTVQIVFGYPIRDATNHVIFGAGVVPATVTGGVFTTDEFVNPRQAGISPANQPLTVRVLTDVYADEFKIEIPEGSTGTLQLSDLAPAEIPPAVLTYLPVTGGTLTGPATWNGTPSTSGHLTPKGYVDSGLAGKVSQAGLDALTTGQGRLSDASLRATFGPADPVLSNFSYDPTGNLLSYQEDAITITLTYNADGTVATMKRGSAPAKTFSYSGGNLVGVA